MSEECQNNPPIRSKYLFTATAGVFGGVMISWLLFSRPPPKSTIDDLSIIRGIAALRIELSRCSDALEQIGRVIDTDQAINSESNKSGVLESFLSQRAYSR